MKHASIFTGIGGFDLAASWLGWENIFQCEIDPFCQRVLKYHFPKTDLYGDIKTTDFSKYRGTIDVISGGFPCQPFSIAGKRKGKEDDRFLWKEMLRAITDVQPSWVVAENVPGLLTIERGMVFEQACLDLENAGYEVQPFIIPACSLNAPHKRDRVWIVAHDTNARVESLQRERENGIFEIITSSDANGDDAERCRYGEEREADAEVGRKRDVSCNRFVEHAIEKGIIANANSKRLSTKEEVRELERGRFSFNRDGKSITNTQRSGRLQNNEREPSRQFTQDIPDWQNFPTQSPICGGNDGVSTRLDGITLSKHRKESLRAYGNAIVPQVAYQIFKTIIKYETNI